MSDPRYRVRCQRGRFANHWVVERVIDGSVMTEGDVKTCLRWVAAWGPMLHGAIKRTRVPKDWRDGR